MDPKSTQPPLLTIILIFDSSPINFDEFLIVLKEFIATVTLSPDVALELKAIIEKFAFSHTFFIKYTSIFERLEFKEM